MSSLDAIKNHWLPDVEPVFDVADVGGADVSLKFFGGVINRRGPTICEPKYFVSGCHPYVLNKQDSIVL
jgi:hypothetical protein